MVLFMSLKTLIMKNIIVEKYESYEDYQIKDNIERLFTFIFSSDNEDDDIHTPRQEIMIDYMVLFYIFCGILNVMPYVRINNEGMKEYGFKLKAV